MQTTSPYQFTPLLAEVPTTLVSVFARSGVTPPAVAIAIDAGNDGRTVFVVDYDETYRDSVRLTLEQEGYRAKEFSTCEAFLASYRPGASVCLVIDDQLLDMHGFDLIGHLNKQCASFICIITAKNAVYPAAVRAIKAGASDFLEKSFNCAVLLASVSNAFREKDVQSTQDLEQDKMVGRISGLTLRQHQVLEMVLAGNPSKNIAADLGTSQRTVENHRAGIARKVGSKSLAGLVNAGICANCSLNQAHHAAENGKVLQ